MLSKGIFTLSASRDSPVATDARFPIVLFAHGNGRRAGTPLPHHRLLLELARRGFIVVAPFFPGRQNVLSTIVRGKSRRRLMRH